MATTAEAVVNPAIVVVDGSDEVVVVEGADEVRRRCVDPRCGRARQCWSAGALAEVRPGDNEAPVGEGGDRGPLVVVVLTRNSEPALEPSTLSAHGGVGRVAAALADVQATTKLALARAGSWAR
jgi:hypothetical protein